MAKELEKHAISRRLKRGGYHGIFDPERFGKYVSLRTYTPSPDLEPFVFHPWVVRWSVPKGGAYFASQILWQPSFNLFLTNERNFVAGVITNKMSRRFVGEGVYAGIKFKPGGFHPLWPHSASLLKDKTQPADIFFPQLDVNFSNELLQKSDAEIVDGLEDILRDALCKPDPNVIRINEILAYITQIDHTPTVKELADKFTISIRTLQALFKEYVGVNIKWVIMRTRFTDAIRIAHAKKTKDWTQIAFDLGYTDQSHFINDFRRIVGVSPAQYQKTMEGNPYTYTKFVLASTSELFER